MSRAKASQRQQNDVERRNVPKTPMNPRNLEFSRIHHQPYCPSWRKEETFQPPSWCLSLSQQHSSQRLRLTFLIEQVFFEAFNGFSTFFSTTGIFTALGHLLSLLPNRFLPGSRLRLDSSFFLPLLRSAASSRGLGHRPS
jgi:hypothetical protein